MPGTRLEPVWNWGEAYKNGKLYCFEPRRLIVARPWPDLRAWVKTPCRPWRPTCMAADRLIMSQLTASAREPDPISQGCSAELRTGQMAQLDWPGYLALRGQRAFAQFFCHIPGEVRFEAMRFLERRWQLLNLFSRCPGGIELSRANPALAFALANNRAFHRPAVQRPFRSARCLLPRSQRDILDWLGFPPTEPARRILRKLAPQALTVPRLWAFRARLTDPAFLKLVSHLPILHAGHLQVLLQPRYGALATPPFLHHLTDHDVDMPWKDLIAIPLWEAVRTCDVLGVPFILPPLRSLKALHDHLHSMRRHLSGLSLASIPTPPFMGSRGIEPLLTTADLVREGMEMKNCSASRFSSVLLGLEVMYRVTEPIRATMSIAMTQDGYALKQVAGPCNTPVPLEVQESIFRQLVGNSFLAVPKISAKK